MGGTITRIVTAAATGGLSEVARAAADAVIADPPKNLDLKSPEGQQLDVLKAKEAVQSKEAEERRARASKRVSTVLTGLGLPGAAPSYTATLQPTAARKSVLG